ncbi:hypothetical protein Hypma_001726 [Hypsizygus marmoreus]|uniref:Uncharacterized protein n=1 Tax=Hypsizygus marmoreus TaxID=39966 RepID=A0A369J9H9_HYPMA|nr:hypothetical protein Hypma_001726 [Hypsizygus marmoreus]
MHSVCHVINPASLDIYSYISQLSGRKFTNARLCSGKGLKVLGSRLHNWVRIEQPSLASSERSRSFFNELPPEIIGEIFIHCLPRWYTFPKAGEVPMLLCQVCSYWRQVAISTPILWSSFSSITDPLAKKATHLSLVKLWLNRSRNQPLSFSLHSAPKSHWVMEEFLKEIHRWHEVVIGLDDVLGRKFLRIQGRNAPWLESVWLTIQPGNWDVDQLGPVLNSFPALHRLQLSNTPTASFVNTPWPRLTHVTIHCKIPVGHFITLLSNTPMLECVILYAKLATSTTPSPNLIVTLSSLRSLKFQAEDSGEVLDHLILPSLLSLDISMPKYYDALRRFSERSACKLKAFIQSDSRANPYGVYCCLKLPCMQSLRELTLFSAVSNQSLALLTWSSMPNSTAGCLMPHLITLILRLCTTTDGIMSRMIASRWPERNSTETLPTSLQHVGLCYYWDGACRWNRSRGNDATPYPVDFSYFEQLASRGLDIHWSTLLTPHFP